MGQMKRCVSILVIGCLQALSQEIPVSAPDGESGYLMVWDGVQDRLLAHRDVDAAALPAVRIHSKVESDSVALYPMRDLAGAQSISIWNVAATPEGGAAIAAIADYGEHQRKSLMLTYDGSGRLRKVWDVDPCHHHRVVVDHEGNIFAFGERHEPKDSNYPLFAKYSPNAKVLAEFLPATLFAAGDDVVSTSPATGEHQLFIRGEEMLLYLAPTKELFRFALAGKLLGRVSLEPVLRLLAEGTESARAEILGMGVLESGEVVVQLRFWPTEGSSTPVRFGLAKFDKGGGNAQMSGPVTGTPTPGRFLGMTSKGKLVFLERRGSATVLKFY